jgi:hypothetical protein
MDGIDSGTSASGRLARTALTSDQTDDEWVLAAPLIRHAKRSGGRRSVDVREVLNAVFSVLSTSCRRQSLPNGQAAPDGRLAGARPAGAAR